MLEHNFGFKKDGISVFKLVFHPIVMNKYSLFFEKVLQIFYSGIIISIFDQKIHDHLQSFYKYFFK